MVCAARGYPFVAVMAESFSVEQQQIMRAYGAKVLLTPAAERGSGMVQQGGGARRSDPAGSRAPVRERGEPREYHRQTTGPEILQDFAGKRLDAFVTGWGTGGTLTGAGQVLKAARPDIQIVVAEPTEAQLLNRSQWKPHKNPRAGRPDFVPAVLDPKIFNQRIAITDGEAIEPPHANSPTRRACSSESRRARRSPPRARSPTRPRPAA